MAIRDLLWGCPLCGNDRPLAEGPHRTAACDACGARYRRGNGAAIVAEKTGEDPVVRSAAEWTESLPEIRVPDGRTVPERTARVKVRFAVGQRAVRSGGGLLGWAETFGDERAGEISLKPDRLSLRLDERQADVWPLEEITAVQPSSSTLQLRRRDGTLVSLEFTEESVRLWEELIQRTLRRFHQEAAGKEILEFQPRIVLR